MYTLKPIKPKGRSTAFDKLPGAVRKGMRDAAEAVKADFEKTTQGWKHEVEFTIEEAGDYDLIVSTDDQIWSWTDEGTDPHTIAPRHAKRLRFATGGAPKTRVGSIISGAGARGSTVVFRGAVRHPGTKARDFSGQIAKKWRRGVAPFIRAAIEEALG